MLGIGNERWVAILTIGSVLFAMGFGLLALFTNYKQDGKVTRWGRVAAGGIALTALISIMLGVLKDRVEAQKNSERRQQADIERTEQKTRFDRQSEAFARLTDQMSASLTTQGLQLTEQKRQNGTQQALVTRTTALLQGTSALRTAQAGSTLQLLRHMWNNANWVSPNSISVMVLLSCRTPSDRPSSHLLEGNWVANLEVLPFETAYHLGTESIGLSSLSQQGPIVDPQASTDETGEIAIFSSFISEEGLGVSERLSSPEYWRGKKVRIDILGPDEGRIKALYEHLGSPVPQARAVQDTEGLGGSSYSGQEMATPIDVCTALVFLRINDRAVAMGEAHIFAVSSPPGTPNAGHQRDVVAISMPLTDVLSSGLPRFGD